MSKFLSRKRSITVPGRGLQVKDDSKQLKSSVKKRSDYINGARGTSIPYKLPEEQGFIWKTADQIHVVRFVGTDTLLSDGELRRF